MLEIAPFLLLLAIILPRMISERRGSASAVRGNDLTRF